MTVLCKDVSAPESLLQFGGGNFLRAFVDLFLHEANVGGQEAGRAVVVTTTPSDRSRWLNDQAGRYHVIVRGLQSGSTIDETIYVEQGISRALTAADQWGAVLDVASSAELRWITSNTTEAGLQLAETEIETACTAATPVSYPAKLLTLLAHRRGMGLGGLTILPCELVDNNAGVLRDLVLEQARRWRLSDALLSWLEAECHWVNTLVDRIVSGRPQAHPLLSQDALLTVTEPFAQWILEEDGTLEFIEHDAVRKAPDVTPYSLRKVRILNGAHTALVARALPLGFTTVRAAVADAAMATWLRRLLEEEILPALGDRIEEGTDFTAAVFERFANPWLDHHLSDIALHHETKLQTRLQPSFDDYLSRFGAEPTLLAELLGR